MGRLSPLIVRGAPAPRGLAVALGSIVLLAACDDKKATPALAPQSRSQAIEATGPAAPAAPALPAPSAPVAAAAHPVLCAQQLGKASRELPPGNLSRAGQQTSLSEKLPVGPGHWTWINLWAAWCVPCKEEIPRLRSWEAKTAGERVPLKVLFVSLDDDGRQLETFLGAQPPGGLQATYWLKDGPERVAWLKGVGMAGGPELPAHILVDPSGKVRCKQQGAIDDTDYVQVLKILRGERGGAGAGTQADDKHGYGGASAAH
jgi:thiol-disulfide isomerase/thioredoxin